MLEVDVVVPSLMAVGTLHVPVLGNVAIRPKNGTLGRIHWMRGTQ